MLDKFWNRKKAQGSSTDIVHEAIGALMHANTGEEIHQVFRKYHGVLLSSQASMELRLQETQYYYTQGDPAMADRAKSLAVFLEEVPQYGFANALSRLFERAQQVAQKSHIPYSTWKRKGPNEGGSTLDDLVTEELKMMARTFGSHDPAFLETLARHEISTIIVQMIRSGSLKKAYDILGEHQTLLLTERGMLTLQEDIEHYRQAGQPKAVEQLLPWAHVLADAYHNGLAWERFRHAFEEGLKPTKEAVFALLDAATLNQAHAVLLEKRALLLTDAALDFLSQVIAHHRAAHEPELAKFCERWLAFLENAQQQDLETAWESFVESELQRTAKPIFDTTIAFLKTNGLDDIRIFLERHHERILTEEALSLLEMIIKEHHVNGETKDAAFVEDRLELVKDARIHGIPAACQAYEEK